MTNEEKQELKQLVSEGTIDALKSDAGQIAIVSALDTPGGQDAIVNAVGSVKGQIAIVSALATSKAKDIFLDIFINAFHEVVVPALDMMEREYQSRLSVLERKVGINRQ